MESSQQMPQQQPQNQPVKKIPTTQTDISTQKTTSTSKLSAVATLPTYEARGAAITKYVDKIKSNPKFQALPRQHQIKVMQNLYDKTVAPSYTGFHRTPPSKNEWAEAAVVSKPEGFLYDTVHGMKQSANKIALFGLKVSNEMITRAYNLDKYLSKAIGSTQEQVDESKLMYQQSKRRMDNAIDATRSRIQSDDFWFDSRPQILGSLGKMTGETILTLPLYSALGTEELIAKGAAKVGASALTARLAASPVGKFVAKRIINATDGFIAALVTSGGDEKEAISGAKQFAAMGVVGSAGESVVNKVASSPLIKKWTANTIAMGGKPFAEEIANSAFVEETHEVAAHETEAMQQHMAEREKSDPVLHKLHEGEKISQNSIAKQMYGKPLRGLSKNQRAKVLAQRNVQIQQAAEEAPVHLPELVEDEAKQSINKHFEDVSKSDPQLAKFQQDLLASLGLDPAKVVAKNQIEQTARRTGISNAPNAMKKLRSVLVPEESEVTEGSASLKPSDFLTHLADTKAYMRAPQNRKVFAGALTEAKKENWNKFYETLKQVDKTDFEYEKPEHRMLFLYGQRSELPGGAKGPLANALVKRIKMLKDFSKDTPTELHEQGKNIINHMRELSKTGDRRNIYASTNFRNPASRGTEWDQQLTDEYVQKVTASTRKALKNNPEALAGFQSALGMFQKKMFKAKTADEYKAFQDALEGSVRSNTKNAKLGNPFKFNQ